MAIFDLTCPQGHITRDVYVKTGTSAKPPCPTCGEPTGAYWGETGRLALEVVGDGIGSFTPVDMGVLGMCNTREEYNRAVAIIQERFPGHTVQLDGDTRGKKKKRHEESKHRAWSNQKAHGLDSKMLAEMKKDAQLIQSVAEREALRRNEDPSKAKSAHELHTKSPQQLAGAVR